MIKALEYYLKEKNIDGKFYLIENYKNDENFPKYSRFYSYLWFKKGKDKILIYKQDDVGVLKDKESIYNELESKILSYLFKDIETGELWKKIKY